MRPEDEEARSSFCVYLFSLSFARHQRSVLAFEFVWLGFGRPAHLFREFVGSFQVVVCWARKSIWNVKWVFCAWKCQARFRNSKLCIFCVSQAIISGMICSFLLRRAPASIDANDSRELYRSEIMIGMIGAALSRRCVAIHWASNSEIDWKRREVINQKSFALRTMSSNNKSALSAPYTFT